MLPKKLGIVSFEAKNENASDMASGMSVGVKYRSLICTHIKYVIHIKYAIHYCIDRTIS
jgi:hypothetical protein